MRFSRRSYFGPLDSAIHDGALHDHERLLRWDLTRTNPSSVGLGSSFALSLPAWDGTYRPEARGTRQARLAIAESYRERASVAVDDLIVTASTSESYSFLFLALCDPGDVILAPSPSYPLLQDLAQLCGVELVSYPLRYDGKWHVDIPSIAQAARVHAARLRAVISVSPNNPTGNCLRENEWLALKRLGLPLIVDEVFRSYVIQAHTPLVDPLRGELNAPLVVLDGFSKRACVPGLKLGWMVVKGPCASGLLSRLEFIADTYLSANAWAQQVTEDLLANERRTLCEVRARIDRNLRTLYRQSRDTPLTALDCEAGWMAIVRAPNLLSEGDWMKRFSEAGIRVQPGSLYELCMSPSFVLSLLTEEKVFEAGVRSMVAVVRNIARAG